MKKLFTSGWTNKGWVFGAAVFFSFAVSLLHSGKAAAQGAPVGCDGAYYVSFSSDQNVNGDVSIDSLYFTGGTVNRSTFPSLPNTVNFNALGINPIDGYMYALGYVNTTGGNRPALIKGGRGPGNNLVSLGQIASPFPTNINSYAGCFDINGDYYFTSGDEFNTPTPGGGNAYALFKMTNAQLSGTRTPTFIGDMAYTGGTNMNAYFVDIAINPVNGNMYGVTTGTVAGSDRLTLFTINKTTGVVTSMGTLKIGATQITFSVFGLFFGEDGTLYGYGSSTATGLPANTGAFYIINPANGVMTQVGTGNTYSSADGANCSFRIAHDLGSTKSIVCPGPLLITQLDTFTVTLYDRYPQDLDTVGFTLKMDPRWEIFDPAATILTNLPAALKSAAVPVTTVFVSASKDSISISNLRIANANGLTFKFVVRAKYPYGSAAPAVFQSKLIKLPALVGGIDLSNNPATPAPDDPIIYGTCLSLPTPVTLNYFKGQLVNNSATLRWETSEESAFSHYEVERSTNGKDFGMVGKVEKHGTYQVYTYQDQVGEVPGEKYFYRLKIVDQDNKFNYSSVVKLTREVVSDMSLYPNPFNDQIQVSVNVTEDQELNISIFSADGREVVRRTEMASAGSNNFTLSNLDNIARGVYIVYLKAGNETHMFKLVK